MKHKTAKAIWTVVAVVGIFAMLVSTMLPAFF